MLIYFFKKTNIANNSIQNNYEFFSRYLPHVKHKRDNGLLEKAKIRWFTFDELKSKKKEFRSFYQNIVDLILKEEKQINSKMKIQLKNEKKRATKRRNKIKHNRTKNNKK